MKIPLVQNWDKWIVLGDRKVKIVTTMKNQYAQRRRMSLIQHDHVLLQKLLLLPKGRNLYFIVCASVLQCEPCCGWICLCLRVFLVHSRQHITQPFLSTGECCSDHPCPLSPLSNCENFLWPCFSNGCVLFLAEEKHVNTHTNARYYMQIQM